MKEKAAGNLERDDANIERAKILKLYGGGLFHEFEWMPDSFDNCKSSLTHPLYSFEQIKRGERGG